MDLTPNVFLGSTCFFVVKGHCLETITISQQHSVWTTTVKPLREMMNAFESYDNVILIFSVNKS